MLEGPCPALLEGTTTVCLLCEDEAFRSEGDFNERDGKQALYSAALCYCHTYTLFAWVSFAVAMVCLTAILDGL